jgi:hypothetical protein
MGDPVLTVSALVWCPHGGQGTIRPAQAAVVAGATVCTEGDQVTIAGCPFTVGGSPSPCVSVLWLTAAVTCTAGGLAVLTTASQGLCINPAGLPQGPVVLSPAQGAAVAT